MTVKGFTKLVCGGKR